MFLPTTRLFLLFIFLFISLLFPHKATAAFNGGINIGDHYQEIEQAVNTVGDNGWIYVLINPADDTSINRFKNWVDTYQNINFVLRGHYPERALTTEDAQKWTQVLQDISRPIYFVPVNEPNNPAESRSGIPAQTVVNYINALRTAGLFNNSNVRILSPAIDVYKMADGPQYQDPSNYARQLNNLSANFFSQFYGLALNLYGEYLNGELNKDAKDVKKGDYKEFIKDYMDINNSPKIFVVETGVKEVEDSGVEYGPNSNYIADYFDLMFDFWGKDPNVEMFSIFSYDPAIINSQPWIYSDQNVIRSMRFSPISATPLPTFIPPSANTNPVIDMYNITKRSNSRLLPQSIQERIIETGCKGGIDVPIIGCLFGTIEPITYQNANSFDLAGETQNFQPVYNPQSKINPAQRECSGITCTLSNIFQRVIAPQMANKPSGSLNAYRPSQLNFSADQTLGIADSSVLAESTNPQQETVESYNFTMKMLLPASLGGDSIVPPTDPVTPVPSIEPEPSISITPIVSPKPPQATYSLRELEVRAGQFFGMPPAIIEAMLIIEGSGYHQGDDLAKLNSGIFSLTDEEIRRYQQPNAKASIYCSTNTCSAAGVMQLTTVGCYPFDTCLTKKDDTANAICSDCPAACTYKPSAWSTYKGAVLEADNDGRIPNICNIKDSIYAATKKMKNDSGTSSDNTSDWDYNTVKRVAERYYGSCIPCNQAKPHTGAKYACDRLGSTYCDFVWNYYQTNKDLIATDDTSDDSVPINQGSRVFYSQNDPLYNRTSLPQGCSMSYAGCGPTTLAMILSTFVDQSYTPTRVVEDFYPSIGCEGSDPWIAQKVLSDDFNFNTTALFDKVSTGEEYYTQSEVAPIFKKIIDAGGQIWANAQIGTVGHHFWITSVDENGTIFVMDPKYGTGKPYPMPQRSDALYKRAFSFKI